MKNTYKILAWLFIAGFIALILKLAFYAVNN